MRRTNLIVVVCYLASLMLLGAFAACASTSTHESTGEYVDDSVITTKVKSLLANDDFFKSFKISVETSKGIVELRGHVSSRRAVDKAGEIARGVDGVKSVRNELVVEVD